MKYSTRMTLALVVLVLSISSLVIYRDVHLFLLTGYPLIAGWIIGECLNIPEEKLWRKWRTFRDTLIIRLINLLDYILGNEEK